MGPTRDINQLRQWLYCRLDMGIPANQLLKVTVPRLHFSETTYNNQRKAGKPNPDQKHFLLVVRLLVYDNMGNSYVVQSYASEKVIVRVSFYPVQFILCFSSLIYSVPCVVITPLYQTDLDLLLCSGN